MTSAEDVRQASPLDSYPLGASTVERWHNERNAGYVLEDETGIVAYGEVNPDPTKPNRFWIGHVIVHPAVRGTGLGQHMVSSLAKLAMGRMGAREVWIGVFADNPPAHACYKRTGFVDQQGKPESRIIFPTGNETLLSLVGGRWPYPRLNGEAFERGKLR